MKKEQSSKLSDEQETMIAHESFMAEVLKYRQPLNPEGKAKPKWLLFLESAGGAALITLLIGGILGGIITAIVQEYQKDREFQQAWLKTRSEMELATAKEYRDRELEIVSQAYDLLGRCITVSDDLIYLTSPVFDPINYEDSLNVKKQRLTMLTNYNNCVREWREKREKLKLLVSYYHQGYAEVVQAWQNVQDLATGYMECAHKWYLEHSNAPVDTEGVCKSQRENYSKKVEQLNISFNAARQYSWEGWKSPGRLRDSLKKNN